MYVFNPQVSSADLKASPRPDHLAAQDSAAGVLSADLLDRLHRYWSAANYLCVGQIYLRNNPLLREPLSADHIKPRLLGHWGTSAGQNFIYVHLNRLIHERKVETVFISGPGHGGPTLNACAWLEGTYSEVHPQVAPDEAGMLRLFRSFSAPVASPAIAGRTRPTRCMKAESWATR